MKKYLKPFIEEEEIELEDIIAVSPGGNAGVPGEDDDNSETLPD